MTPISSTNNATAISILKRMNASRSAEISNTLSSVLGPLEPIGNAGKQAVEKIVAILNNQSGTFDLSSYSGNAVVSAGDNATIITGDGDDSIGAQNGAKIWSGKGNDAISTYHNANIDAGAGDDVIDTYNDATINAGDGDDRVYTYSNSIVDAGAGNDYVVGNDHVKIDGGDGNDQIRTYDYATVDAGEGDDVVVTLGNSTINGGSGNDILLVSKWRGEPDSTFDNSNVDGGDGDDYIQVNGYSTVMGGGGNDTIRLLGDGNTVNFNKGDGQDAIWIGQPNINIKENATVNVKGYNVGDVTVMHGDDNITVSFNGSDDTLTFQFAWGAKAKLAFEDGSTLDVIPTTYAALKEMDINQNDKAARLNPVLHF